MRRAVAPKSGPLTARLRFFLPRQGFSRSLAIVTGGTAASQIVSFAASPLLSRLFAPSDFGALAIYMSLSGPLAMVGALAYHLAIPLPAEDEEAANLLFLVLALTAAASVLTACGLAVFHTPLAAWHRAAPLAGALWLVPIGALGLGMFEALSQWAVRTKAFGPLARTNIRKATVQAGLQVGWGVLAPSALGLIVGQTLGHWSGTFRLAGLAWRNQHDAIRRVTVRGMAQAARRYKRFPLLTLPELALNAVSFFAPVLILAYYFGGAVAGLYALQDRVTLIPIRLVSSSAQRVFFSSAADARRDGSLDVLTRKVIDQLLQLGLPFIVLLAASAPSAFSVIFGDEWREAGVYAQWLCVRAAFTMVGVPLTPLVYVLEKQWAGTTFQVLLLVARLAPLVIGGAFGSALLGIGLSGVLVGLAWFLYLLFLIVISGNRVRPVLRSAGKETLVAGAFAVPVVAVRLLGASDVAVTGLAAGVGGAAMLLVLRRRGSPRLSRK